MAVCVIFESMLMFMLSFIRVVAIDMRGYGETSKPPNITDYSTVLLAKDIDDLIHELGETQISSALVYIYSERNT